MPHGSFQSLPVCVWRTSSYPHTSSQAPAGHGGASSRCLLSSSFSSELPPLKSQLPFSDIFSDTRLALVSHMSPFCHGGFLCAVPLPEVVAEAGQGQACEQPVPRFPSCLGKGCWTDRHSNRSATRALPSRHQQQPPERTASGLGSSHHLQKQSA